MKLLLVISDRQRHTGHGNRRNSVEQKIYKKILCHSFLSCLSSSSLTLPFQRICCPYFLCSLSSPSPLSSPLLFFHLFFQATPNCTTDTCRATVVTHHRHAVTSVYLKLKLGLYYFGRTKVKVWVVVFNKGFHTCLVSYVTMQIPPFFHV